MIKKLVQTAIIGGALLGMTAGASADTININIYGASAQYDFWTNAAGDFLTDQGCSGTVYTAVDADDKHGIAKCDDLNGDTVYIRYSSKASFDGIRSVQGLDPDGDSGSCADNEREMANEADTNWTTGEVNSLSCEDVTIGASDVAAATFQQESHGLELGPKVDDENLWEDRSIYNITMDSNYNVFRPIVVPFAFFRNANSSTPVPYDNMSRLMATALFSGQVTDWNEFDPSKSSLPVVICMRHAGSGTHATLDAAVMRGDYTLMNTEALPGSFPVTMGLQPVTYFNDGSSDMARCIGGAGTRSGYETYTGVGAVGYADSDKVKMSDGTLPAPNNIAGEYHDLAGYGDLKLMTWQGESAVKINIVNGKYDFWSAQWLYTSPSEPDAVNDLVDALVAYASVPANLPPSKAAYWATQNEMKVEKATDFTYPKFK
ncbi:MAG: substrate-binding domain-containing protein [Deltaproteobacteria bacterium]|nr:substrate-binding domain-containing protein [Deltaproteobacteria bacterium]